MNARPIDPNRRCKGCDHKYQISQAQIERAVAMLEKEPERCVPNEVYEERLGRCRACVKLQHGNTCTLCGCIVQIAAKLRERGCPMPGKPLWMPLESLE